MSSKKYLSFLARWDLIHTITYRAAPRVMRSDTVVKTVPFGTSHDRAGIYITRYDTTTCGRGAGADACAGRTCRVAPGGVVGSAVKLCRPCALRDPRT
eukprot:4905754-Pleurochrysis_carterae.AAC.1